MEKLFFSRLLILIMFLIGSVVRGQEYYCVFKVDGTPLLNDSIALQKGVFINAGQFLKLDEEDEVVLLDDNGAIYELKQKMYIPFKNIEKFSKRPEQTSFTMKYLRFIWNKLWQEEEEKENIGVVFRSGLANVLLEPADSVVIYKPQVVFKWLEKQKGETTHFFIRNNNKEDYLKIATNGNMLIVPVDANLLEGGAGYQWAVSTETEPEMGSLAFNSFELLTEDSYDLKMQEIKEIWQEFQALGFTENEIKTTFCEDKGLCFD